MTTQLCKVLCKVSDYKICKCCKAVNWYENEDCCKCGDTDFDERGSVVTAYVDEEYSFYSKDGYSENQIDDFEIEV